MIVEYRDGDLRVPVGGLLELGDDEAARLIMDGVAIPACDDEHVREYRATGALERRVSPPRAPLPQPEG